MKLADQDPNLLKSRGVAHKQAFQIAATAKMTKLLSDDLYSDKITAVIRELSCNAKDAHVEAGTPKLSFRVHLPTRSEPWYEIQDFGPGMSRDKLCNLYQTYGLSDKDDTNDMIGAWGLGSKSPLAYTNQFTVTNIYQGLKYVIIVATESDGIPTLNFMLDGQHTDEPDGVSVKIMLKSTGTYEIDQWREKAEAVYKWFPVQPETNVPLRIEEDTFVFETEDCKLKGDNGGGSYRYRGYEKSYAIMGNICYPINGNEVPGNDDILDYGAVLYFDIGEVIMDPSRERLQYTKHTVDNIQKKIQKLRDLVQKHIDKELKEAKCMWDAVVIKEGYSGILKRFSWQYNGKPVDSRFQIYDFDRMFAFKNGSKEKMRSYFSVHTTGKSHFLDQDVSATSHIRAKTLSEQNPKDVVYLICQDGRAEADRLKKIKDNFGLNDSYVRKVSDLPKPKITRKKGGSSTSYVFDPNFSGGSKWNKSDWWSPVDDTFDMDDGGYYVEIDYYDLAGNHMMSPGSFKSMLDDIQAIGINIPDYVAVKKAKIDKFKDHDDWEDLFEKLQKDFKQHLDDNKYTKRFSQVSAFNACRWGLQNEIGTLRMLDLPKNHDIKKFCAMYDGLDKIHTKFARKLQGLVSLGTILKVNVEQTDGSGKNPYDLNGRLASIKDRFSILKHVHVGAGNVTLVSRVIKDFGEH